MTNDHVSKEVPSAVTSGKVTPDIINKILGRAPPFTEHDVSRQRLAAALQQAETDIRLANDSVRAAPPQALALAEDKLDDAIKAALQGRATYQAWDLILQIERLLASCDDNDERRRMRIARYVKEADAKLSDWRKDFVDTVAKRVRLQETTEVPEEVMQGSGEVEKVCPDARRREEAVLLSVMEIVHQASQNQQQKIALIRQQSRYLLGLFIPTLALVLVVGYCGGFDWTLSTTNVKATEGVPSLGQLLVSGALIGFFGGLMSIAFALSKSDRTLKIPMIRSALSIQTLRPVLGAAAAIPVVFLVKAGFIDMGDKGYMALASLCFLAGFSERWFIEKIDASITSSNKK